MLFSYIDPGTGYTVVATGLGALIAVLVAFMGVVGVFFKRILNFLKKPGRKGWIAIIVCALAIGGVVYHFASGGSMEKNPQVSFKGRVIILGMDGVSPKIIEPMIKAGKLPHFAKLMSEGSYQHLSTTNPSQSPVAWTGFSTGQNGGKNGLFDFIVRDPSNYSLTLSTSNIERGVAKPVVHSRRFWEYASDAGVPSVVLCCPITFPPDKINGRMISGMGVPDILGTEGTYTFYTTEQLPEATETGGKAVHLEKAATMKDFIYGPKKQVSSTRVENVTVPLSITVGDDKKSVKIEIPGDSFTLSEGKWSDWKSVSFSIALFKKMKGIMKFYLVSAGPELKLYMSPINFDPRDPAFEIAYPLSYAKELSDKIGLYHTQGMPTDTWALNGGRLSEKPFIEHLNDILGEKKRMLEYELGRVDHGILYSYFDTSDTVQHMFWRCTDPKNPLYKTDKEYDWVIQSWYEKMDEILGEVMAKLKPDDTLFVMSDHGFDAYRHSVNLNTWLRKNGYLQLKNPGAKEGAELLGDIDWNNTKAYAIGFGAIYLNQMNREAEGIVPSGSDAEKLKKEIAAKLEKWVDPKTGEKVINNVYPREEIFWGDYADKSPDLYVGFNSGFRASWQTALGAVPDDLIEENLKKWSGDHLIDPALVPGILFSNRKLRQGAKIYDIAPTVLKIIGFNEQRIRDCKFDGEPLL
jgi:predicted AlkP superfamily phosphohydrolase/phosphomutase